MIENANPNVYVEYACALLATYEPFTKLTPDQVIYVVKKHRDIVAKAKSGDIIPTFEVMINAMFITGELKPTVGVVDEDPISEINDEFDDYNEERMLRTFGELGNAILKALLEINKRLEKKVEELQLKVKNLEIRGSAGNPYYPYYPVYPNWEPMKITYIISGSNHTTKGKE